MHGGEVDANPGHRSDEKVILMIINDDDDDYDDDDDDDDNPGHRSDEKVILIKYDDDDNLQTEGHRPLQSPVTFSVRTIDLAIPNIDEEASLPPT